MKKGKRKYTFKDWRLTPWITVKRKKEESLKTVDYYSYIRSDAWQQRRKLFFERSQRVLEMRRKYGTDRL